MIDVNALAQKAIALLVEYAPKLGLAILTLVVGLWVINKVIALMTKALQKNEVDVSLGRFMESLAGILLKTILIISVASMVGIATTSFIAILGAAGLAVGLALQGSLANFAGGVLILLFKPFKVGDFIIAQGEMGSVKSIQVFCTVLTTPDNQRVIIPNGPLAGGNIKNVTAEPTRRVDWTFGIGYSDDIAKAKTIITDILKSNKSVLKDPAPMVAVSELADSSVNFVARAWVNKADYWDVHFSTIEAVKLAFDAKGISIPFPQQDIHVISQPSNGAAKDLAKSHN